MPSGLCDKRKGKGHYVLRLHARRTSLPKRGGKGGGEMIIPSAHDRGRHGKARGGGTIPSPFPPEQFAGKKGGAEPSLLGAGLREKGAI